jgi:nucleotide-binding universal stress UspA family protein
MLAEERELPFQGVFLRGSLTRSIIALANQIAANVIVIGDIGLTGIKRVLLGSVAESIVEASHVPVLVVKQHAHNKEDK